MKWDVVNRGTNIDLLFSIEKKTHYSITFTEVVYRKRRKSTPTVLRTLAKQAELKNKWKKRLEFF